MSYFEDLFRKHVQEVSISGEQLSGICPFHDDKNPSFSANIKNGMWKCHGCDASGNAEQFAEKVGEPFERAVRRKSKVVDRYVYEDEEGGALFSVCRTERSTTSLGPQLNSLGLADVHGRCVYLLVSMYLL